MRRILVLISAVAVLCGLPSTARGTSIIREDPSSPDVYAFGFRVSFTSPEDALCGVRYGTTTAYGSNRMQSPFGRRSVHNVLVPGTSPATEYHYQIWCTDEGYTVHAADRRLRTATQTTRFSFDNLQVLNDGDDSSAGDDLYWAFAIHDAAAPPTTKRYPRSGYVDVDDRGCGRACTGRVPSGFAPVEGLRMLANIDATTFTVRVTGSEDDTTWNEAASDRTWATRSLTLTTPAYEHGWSRVMQMCADSGDSDGRLRYCVDVQLHTDFSGAERTTVANTWVVR